MATVGHYDFETLSYYVDKEFSKAKIIEIKRHTNVCEKCAAVVKEIRTVNFLVRHTVKTISSRQAR